MTKVIITTSGAYIKAEPGLSATSILTAYRQLSSMRSVLLFSGTKGTYVEVHFSETEHWTLDVTSKRGDSVSVNGATPASNEELALTLAGLLI